MFLKSKIGLTVLSLYEIIAILLLHCPNTCNAMFGLSFCTDHIFKYFIWCVAVPLLVFLIVMWIMDIIHRVRRRHSLLFKAKHAVRHMAKNIRDRVSEHVSSGDMEKLISGALIIGLRRYSNRNPRARHILNDMMNGNYGDIDVEYDEYEMDDDADYEYTENNQRGNKSNKSQQKNNRKKK